MHGSDRQPEKESCAGIVITPLAALIVTLLSITVPASHNAEMYCISEWPCKLSKNSACHTLHTLGVGTTASLIHPVLEPLGIDTVLHGQSNCAVSDMTPLKCLCILIYIRIS